MPNEGDIVSITAEEVAETLNMVTEQHLDIRTITMGISLMGCADENLDRMCTKVYDRITTKAEHLVETAENLEREYGIPIVNKRVSVTPIAQIAAACPDVDLVPLAHALDRAAETLGIDYLGGYSALVHKGIGDADRRLINCIPEALASTSRVCSSVNVASLRAGINMDAVLMAAQTIIDAAKLTADRDSVRRLQVRLLRQHGRGLAVHGGRRPRLWRGGRRHQRGRLRPRRHGAPPSPSSAETRRHRRRSPSASSRPPSRSPAPASS